MRILLGCPERDGAGIRRLLQEGAGVEQAEPFEELASIALHSGPYDAIVISASTARGQAIPALRELRRAGVRQPVLVLVSNLTAEEEGMLLDIGGDDVLIRPVTATVLLARLRAALRRTLGHASPVLVCGNVELDQARRSVNVDGRPAVITRREFDLLETLMLRRGMPMSKDSLMSRLYGDEDGPDPRIVDVFVCKLRRKLAAAGAAEIVRTVWGRGYAAEEPGAAAIAAARARYAAGVPRKRRAHLMWGAKVELVAV